MSRTFNVGTNPVDADHKIYKHTKHTINPGVTVLVGCNGSGKSTLLLMIKEELERKDIPCFRYDNLKDGGDHAIQKNAFYENWSEVAFGFIGSEGENIMLNIGQAATKLGRWMRSGKEEDNKLVKAFAKAMWGDEVKNEEVTTNERWVLFDAVDSGFSIDNVIDLKELLFKTMLDDAKQLGVELYIVVSANEYELACGEACYDVQSCKYVDINSYEDYKKLILQTRKWKDERIEKGRK